MGRRARVVVAGDVGEPPVVETEVPWWAETRSLVAAAEAAVGAPLRVLRRLSVESGENGRDSEVTYLFEREGGPPADEPDHPLRSPWARTGWIDDVLAWEPIASRLAGRPVQEKWWNLSAVLEIPTAEASVWLKAIPSFFADEGRVLQLLGAAFPGRVPKVLAAAERVALLAPVAGEDQWQVDDAGVDELIHLLTDIHWWSVDRLGRFIDAGASDWRADSLEAVMPEVGQWARELDALGLPTTLLHGDFHPGNARGTPGRLVLLDWTDAAVGCPLLDLPSFLSWLAPERAAATRELVARAWSQHVTGIDFDRGFALAEVVRAAWDAHTYQTFLDGVEPSERIDHETDVVWALRRLDEATHRLQ